MKQSQNLCRLLIAFCVSLSAPAAVTGVPDSAVQTVRLSGDAGGKRFDGIGAVSGGGATSVLLKDYPEPQRSQILDLLFKPKFGASMSTLLVEVPGDGNSTQGAEPSHMHTRGDLNFYRGYEWWIMREAKKRNRDITLDACAWGAPGWIGNGQFWSQDMADYYVKWIDGLKSAHGLDLAAIGCRNEKGVDLGFPKMLRAKLNASGLQGVRVHGFDNWGATKFDWVDALSTDGVLRESIDIISNHTMAESPASPHVRSVADSLGKPLWNTEEHVYLKGFECEIRLVQCFNENFIRSGVTKVVNWYLVGSVYPTEPFPEDPAALIANSPWSGFYRPREVLWGYAHYGQFSNIGWTYLNGGCGRLHGGGTFVTLKSPGEDYSVIIETKDATAPQSLTFAVGAGLSTRPLCVWRSNAREQFVQQRSIQPVNGSFTATLDPKSIYSFSTTTGQQKGAFPDIPQEHSFPFPYRETFDEYRSPRQLGYLPHYTADIVGVFEVVDRPGGGGRCLRQVVAQKPISWAPEWMPYTIVGDGNWTDYAVSADVLLADDGGAGVMGRINEVGTGYGTAPKAYYLRLMTDGACSLIAVNGKAGPQELGDKEHQERLRAEAASGKSGDRGEKGVGGVVVKDFDPAAWHKLRLEFSGSTISGFVDGVKVISATNTLFTHGMAGLVACDGHSRSTAYFDNLSITPIDASEPAPAVFSPSQQPIYDEAAPAALAPAREPK
jgi:galactosylceramidase